MKLDDLNRRYFELLSSKEKEPTQSYKIAASPELYPEQPTAFSTAIIPKVLLKELPTTLYESLADPSYIGSAKKVIVKRKKMFAGIGSSIERKTHLQKHNRNSNGELGAKGTDLFITIPHPKDANKRITVSFAEAQILQGILSAERAFKKVVFENLVSTETQKSLETIWNQPCLLDSSKTYRQYIQDHPALELGNTVTQANLPTLTSEGKPSHNRLAPGGHGFFGFEVLQTLIENPKVTEPTLSFLSNGEDLSAHPDAQIAGWMIERQLPICMVVTEKTAIDRKGGQLAVVMEPVGKTYVALVETAQAKAAGQLDLFESLGLSIKTEKQVAYFNTNLAIFNEGILKEKLEELRLAVGNEELWKALTPDVIHNWKEQTDKDGVKRKYLQLEGAMGSVLLNLDKLSRKVLGQPLVHFLLVSKNDRSRFFSPVKTAFDLFLQYYSDKYGWDSERMSPINKHPGRFPSINLETDDVETVLNQFKNADLSSYFL